MKSKTRTCNSVIRTNIRNSIPSRWQLLRSRHFGLKLGVVLTGALAALIAANDTSAKEAESSSNKTWKDSKTKPDAMVNYAKLPVAFEPNAGQSDKKVRFLAHTPGGTFYFCSDQLLVSLRQSAGSKLQSGQPGKAAPVRVLAQRDVVGIQFIKANAVSPVRGQKSLPGKVNYLHGNDSASWHTNLPTYAEISYDDLYPGTRLTYQGTGGQIESTYTIEPGGDPSRIRWRYDGADSVSVDATGNLLIKLPSRSDGGIVSLTESTPIAWQNVDGRREPRKVRYAVASDKSIGFSVEDYDPSHRLTIDPVLSYSTYFGGATDNDFGISVAVDRKGYAYITGYTLSSDFPTVNPLPGGRGALNEAFVTKFNQDGSEVIYSTYLGGNGQDIGRGIAVDSAGHAYVTGETSSTDFPLVHAFQTTGGNGGLFSFVAFVSKLRANGSALVFSTYLGGTSGYDIGYAIAVDDARNTFVTGQTLSSDFPTLNPIQAVNGGATDAFVTKFTRRGSQLVYSTYLGGSNFDYGLGIAVDRVGSAHIAGYTFSGDFPTANPLQSTLSGVIDAFVTKINPAGSALQYSTFLGGTSSDFGNAIAVDASGDAYITGQTDSDDFPTANAFQPAYGGGQDAFIARLNRTGVALVYSTYLGGSGSERGFGIALNRAGEAYVTGDTFSTDFPVVDPIQGEAGGGGADAMVAKLNASGSALVYSTYLGGTGAFEMGNGIAVDQFGNAYIAGTTNSPDFPNTRPGIRPPGPDTEPFIAKISEF